MKRILNTYALKVVSVLFLGGLLFSLSSCNNTSSEKNKLKRNILFYIATDDSKSSIDGDVLNKINQMRVGWKPGQGELLIYADRRGQRASLFRVNDKLGSDGLYGLDTLTFVPISENSADPAVLAHVINEMKVNYSADSYGMIFFSHASGWLPKGMLNSSRSLVIDNGEGGANEEMEYSEFAAAIPDKQFDFIIFEACLMADVVAMYELRDKADYILASSAEIVSPGFEYIYKNAIMTLFNQSLSIDVCLKNFGQAYYDFFTAQSNVNMRSATISLVKMDEMENLAAVTKAALQGNDVNEDNLEISDIQIYDRPRAFGASYARYFDLGHAIESLSSESYYNKFEDQLNKTVIWKAATKSFLINQSGFEINHHSGLTTYIKRNAYPVINSEFEESAWYKAIQ